MESIHFRKRRNIYAVWCLEFCLLNLMDYQLISDFFEHILHTVSLPFLPEPAASWVCAFPLASASAIPPAA